MSDLRDAWRALRAAPIVSAVAVLSLALGIGANTAIFSIVNSLLVRTLPVRDPERLVAMQSAGDEFSTWTYPIWEEVRRHAELVDGGLAFSTRRFNLARSGQTEFVEGLYVNGSFFDVLGVPAILGRTFTEDDDRRGARDGPVAIISHAYWQSHFGGAADAVGRQVTLERVPFTIIGVTPPSFFGATVGRTFDVAVPFSAQPLLDAINGLDERRMWWVEIMLRLRPDQSIEAATSALRGVQPQIREATIPLEGRPDDLAEHLKEPFTLQRAAAGVSDVRTRFAQPMIALMGVVGLVLLIACANIANLMLARSTARRHELTVRAALGASRARLARQLLAESLLLSACGGLLGLLFARGAGRLLLQQMSTPRARMFLDLGLDVRVLGFTAAAAVGTALLFGIAPAFRATRVRATDVLREQGRGAPGDRLGFGGALVVVQIALSLMLVVAAGLFVGTFARLATLDRGFEGDRVLVAAVNAQRSTTPAAERLALFERLRRAAAAAPGVAIASASVVTPVGGMVLQFRVAVPGGSEMPDRERVVHVNFVSPDFFATYGTHLLAGREFTVTDRQGAAPVAIVNEAFARKFMNGTNPVGRTVQQEETPREPAVLRAIVGYAEDAIYRNLRQPVPPTLYLPLAQANEAPFTSAGVQISVRAATGSPALLTRSVAAALTGVDPDLALTFQPLEDQVRSSLAQERVIALLSGFFGSLALLLAALGLYGVTAYAVSRRRTEIGIRMALGAEPDSVVRMVLRRVALLVAAGVLVGTIASLWAATFVDTLLFGLGPRDASTLTGAALVLTAIGLLAGWLPARRASRVDPAAVLREA